MGAEQLFNGPIPGESLTRSPSERGPYEMPPKFASTAEAMDYLLGVITSDNFIDNFAEIIKPDKAIFVDKLTAELVKEGFINGLWTVDTAMLLVEPLMALMIWAAAQLDATVSFSNDTGYEDRTGFDYVTDALIGDPNEIMIQQPEEGELEQEGLDEQPEIPEQPNAPVGASPLLGGL